MLGKSFLIYGLKSNYLGKKDNFRGKEVRILKKKSEFRAWSYYFGNKSFWGKETGMFMEMWIYELNQSQIGKKEADVLIKL